MIPGLEAYLDLVRRLDAEVVNRGENDLSSRLARATEALGLHTVVDTAGGSDRRGRPDISCYVDRGAADLVSAADVVVESKKPAEVAGFPDLGTALASDELWKDKFVRYVRAHSQQISWFVLTSFHRFLAVRVTDGIRSAVWQAGAGDDGMLKAAALATSREFDLRDPAGAAAWARWVSDTLDPAALRPPALSTILDLKRLNDTVDLEQLAEALADVAVGKIGRQAFGAGLLSSIDLKAATIDELDDGIRNSLVFHTLARHSGMTMAHAATHLGSHLNEELADFVAASVHSLVGRLFAYKSIEDCFCVSERRPLIERDLWVFHTDRYDQIPPESLPGAVFGAMRLLSAAANPVVRGLAQTGRFYDWVGEKVEPTAFRRLVSLFFQNDFRDLDGDLLGRFFEIYSQRVNSSKRKEKGQYYTPTPIVAFMWNVNQR